MLPLVCVGDLYRDDAPTTEIYTLSLHDALPILVGDIAAAIGLDHRDGAHQGRNGGSLPHGINRPVLHEPKLVGRSEEHTSELQSRLHLVCRLLLEKKKSAGCACG